MIKANGKKYAIPSDFGLSSSSFTFAFVGLLLLVVAYPIFDFTKVLAQSTEENNINTVRRVAEAFNTGNVSNVPEFIRPQYFNHESQVDPIRGQLRGPEEFIDTVENLRTAFPKIVEHKAIRDDLTFLAQLGVVKPSSANYELFFQVLTGTMNATNSSSSE